MASIEKRGKNSWRFVVEAGYDPNGKRIKRSKTIKIEDEALLRTTRKLKDFLDMELAKFKIEVEAGEYVSPEKMSFSSFVIEWKNKYAIKTLSPSTLTAYMAYLNKRILPVLGHKRIDEIKPIHIVNLISSITDSPREGLGHEGTISSGTVAFILRILKNVFSRAAEWKLIKESPAAGIKKPKVNYKEFEIYNEDEIERLFAALENEPPQWRVMIALALTTGLRRGELLGLEWHHIDLENGLLEVRQTLSGNALDGQPILSEPKTKQSRRILSLPESMIEELKFFKQVNEKAKNVLGDRWKGENRYFVFSKHDGEPYHHKAPYLWFRRFLLRHKLRHIRFHDLRHTSASLLISQGVHAKLISSRLGHSSISTTMNIYGHALRSADREVASKLNNLLPGRKNK
ncbi:tyrosine-type recombinase/integrase [Paenibacillus gansuensis]|uniref:Tyrosine-type recombinase/integrase n=1 Tax=Paenibacillus gansuensis TaxID=306542 RepID=A0ABW5PI58_9BACL